MCFFQCSGSGRKVLYVFLPVFLTMQCLSETVSASVFLSMQWLRETGCVCVSTCVSYNAVA